ncbi:hypothetical protein CYMTET_56194 [Cymbomonas tetramitiformis]|uniref:Histone acetyltransferase n=1 Tax=Cymbomonas tetramitiformis TaxID=36881 RepID=A0AAE0BCN9_9CHLO|nr:hypothetical protein CYMTET_56194 [Cymbomonas tetramitiformis]
MEEVEKSVEKDVSNVPAIETGAEAKVPVEPEEVNTTAPEPSTDGIKAPETETAAEPMDADEKKVEPQVIHGAGKGKRVMVSEPEPALASTPAGEAAPSTGNTLDESVPSTKSAQGKDDSIATAQPESLDDKTAGPSTSASPLLPLEVGTKVNCLWRDNKWHQVRVIERRKLESEGPDTEYQYYVHYVEFNRRLDEWVSLKNMDLSTVLTEDAVQQEGASGRTRNQKRKNDEVAHEDGHEEFDPASLREHEEFTKVKNINRIEMGKFDVQTWYFSPFPAEFAPCEKLYFCEFCLNFMKRKEQQQRHMRKCELRHPPGDEIYRSGNVAFFEVDGKKEKIYCQNLCYLAKLFLDHKTLYYDVDLFLFYILCECDERGYHVVGYFSKEKNSEEGYNLACILTFPQYQRKGFGKILIAFSYELSKKEHKVGTPERPLSDLGLLSYRSYWTRVLLNIIKKRRGNISIKDLSEMTAIKTDDIISTLQHLNLIQYQKGQHVIYANPKIIEQQLKEVGSGAPIDASKLIWTPYNSEKDYVGYRG